VIDDYYEAPSQLWPKHRLLAKGIRRETRRRGCANHARLMAAGGQRQLPLSPATPLLIRPPDPRWERAMVGLDEVRMPMGLILDLHDFVSESEGNVSISWLKLAPFAGRT